MFSSEFFLRILQSSPLPFTPGLYWPWYFPLAKYERTETLIRHNLSSVYVSCVYFHSRSKNNLQVHLSRQLWILLWCFTLIFIHFKFSNTLKYICTKCDNFTFHANVCILIRLFSQRYVTWNPYLLEKHTEGVLVFFTAGDKWKKVNKYLMKKWKRNDYVFFKMQIFVSAINKS